LGRHLVESALSRGHVPTLFNRGRSDPGLFPEVEQGRGDRDGGMKALKGRSFDAVLDTSGYLPRLVRQAVAAELAPRYVFFSSVTVYADGLSDLPLTEEAPRRRLEAAASEDVDRQSGELKAACEDLLPQGALLVRPGLIAGPHDPTERFT